MRIVIATSNQGKLNEFQKLFPKHVELLTLKDINYLTDIDETGVTLEENALLKATTIWKYLLTHPHYKIELVIADDSGLEVSALNGAPGVYSARYAGVPKNDTANNLKLLEALKNESNRKAQFRTVLAFVNVAEQTYCEGIIEGTIGTVLKGDKGFGYDPLFIPNGYTQTFAELDLEIKNKISHRALALIELLKLV